MSTSTVTLDANGKRLLTVKEVGDQLSCSVRTASRLCGSTGAMQTRAVFAEIPSMPDFRTDLKAAGIDEQDSRGRKVVLHSLRHSLATMLAISNVPMVVAQKIMRHHDIRLTADTYTDEGLLPLSAAMATLPRLGQAG